MKNMETPVELRPSLDLLPANLLSVTSRTRCSPESASLFIRALSSRIASFYSPLASPLSFDQTGVHWNIDADPKTPLAIKARDWRPINLGSHPVITDQFKKELGHITPEMFTDVYVRYMYYIHGEKSPAESALPDFASLRLLKRLYWDSLAPQAQAEIVRVYQTSQKQAILNYVLIHPLNRATLCIPFIPVKTSCSRPTPRLSPEEAASVAQSRSQLIYVQSGYSCRKIRTLWFSEFRNFRFFSKSG